MNKDDVVAIYDAELEALKKREPEAAPSYLLKHAFAGTRTRVHEALQAANAYPKAGEEHKHFHAHRDSIVKGETPITTSSLDELHRLRADAEGKLAEKQKIHFTDLWVQADALIASAGITEGGHAS